MKVFCPHYNEKFKDFTGVQLCERFLILPIMGENFTQWEWVDTYQDADIVFFRTYEQMSDEEWQRFFNCFQPHQLLVDATHLRHISDLIRPYHILHDTVNHYKKFLSVDRFMVIHFYHLDKDEHCPKNLQYVDYSQSQTKALMRGGEVEEALFAYCGPDSEHKDQDILNTGWFYFEYMDKESFTLTDLDNLQKPTWKDDHDTVCMYLSLNTVPNRKHFNHQYAYLDDPDYEFIVERRSIFRKRLYDELLAYPGHLSNKEMGTVILTQTTHMDLIKQIIRDNFAPSSTPVMNEYYDTSVISPIIETITLTGSALAATEKTFYPLAKGHFIVPFGPQGTIGYLKSKYGIKFPDWIDYSYDDSPDDIIRFEKFILSIKKVLNRGHEWLFDKKFQDIEILKHNRSRILDHWYGSFYQAHQRYKSQL